MNSNKNNYGYIFKNYFDLCCYTIIAVIYPSLVFFIQTSQLNAENFDATLLSGFFFCLTYFYDFYSRFRDCENQTEFVVKFLFLGRNIFVLLFCFLVGLVFVRVWFFNKDWFNMVPNLFYICPIFSVYPFSMALIEWYRRLKVEPDSKISSGSSLGIANAEV